LKPAEYHAASRKLQEDRAHQESELHVAVLSSNSLEFLNPFLIVEAAERGLFISTFYSPYGQVEQVLLQADSFQVRQPDVIVVALRIEDQVADAFLRSRRRNGKSLQDIGEQCIERLMQCIEIIRRTSEAHILVANFSLPFEENNARLFDANYPGGCSHTIEKTNFDLATAVSELSGVAIWDYAGLVRENGSRDWTDQRLWQVARQGIATANRPQTAAHLVSTIDSLLKPRSKCLVLDLDNTLWGGVAGDDGLQGISLGDDHPGLAFKKFQRAVLSLADQGILLSICSKNDEDLVRRVIDSHPDMLIQWDDFLAAKVNWLPKSENLKAIAADLNIGLNSLVLFDDNPVEREEVRINAPAVDVIEVPSSPIDYANALFSSGRFDTPSLSHEDLQRSDYYRTETKRRNLGSTFASVDDFLASLQMTAAMGSASNETFGRIAHLLAKTNQYNLTTRRHSQARVATMTDSADWDVRWIRVADRYGDNGIVGITITNYDGTTARIDSLLMSCRVMNRHVEDAMMADIVNRARERRAERVIGEFVPTERNAVVADFYLARGFKEVQTSAGTGHCFEIDIVQLGHGIDWPDTIAIDGNET